MTETAGCPSSIMIEWRTHRTSDPAICGGQLCAKGTRVLVPVILDSLAEGASREESLLPLPRCVNVKLDENAPAELLDDLRGPAHEADTVRGEGSRARLTPGISDQGLNYRLRETVRGVPFTRGDRHEGVMRWLGR